MPKRKGPARVIPLLEEAEIAELAKRFAASIPEDELSVCAIYFTSSFAFACLLTSGRRLPASKDIF